MVLDDKQASDLSPHGRRDQQRSRLGRALHARGDVRSVAEHLARGIDDHGPAVEPDTGGEGRQVASGVRRIQVFERAEDNQAGASRAFRVILLRPRISEQRHEPVAQLLRDMAAVLADRLAGVIEIGLDEIAPVLGVERGREAGRSDQIAEHYGDGPPLRFVSRAGRGDGGGRRLQRGQTRDRLE